MTQAPGRTCGSPTTSSLIDASATGATVIRRLSEAVGVAAVARRPDPVDSKEQHNNAVFALRATAIRSSTIPEVGRVPLPEPIARARGGISEIHYDNTAPT